MAKKLDLKGLSQGELTQELEQLENQYNDLLFNHSTQTLQNTAEIKTVRRKIAQVKTQIRSKELEVSTVSRDRIVARRRTQKKIKK
jgi:large subunit ribosomal protein L29